MRIRGSNRREYIIIIWEVGVVIPWIVGETPSLQLGAPRGSKTTPNIIIAPSGYANGVPKAADATIFHRRSVV